MTKREALVNVHEYHQEPRRFAYVFYATDEIYFCSALIGFKRLKALTHFPLNTHRSSKRATRGKSSQNKFLPNHQTYVVDSPVNLPEERLRGKPPSQFPISGDDARHTQDTVDFVLLHNGLQPNALAAWDQMGGKTRRVLPLRLNWWFKFYAQCDLKLHIFGLSEYFRVVFMDSDSMVYKSLDALLTPKIVRYSTRLAGAQLYWQGNPNKVSSALVVVTNPSTEMFNDAERLGKEDSRNKEDLELLNSLMEKYTSAVIPHHHHLFVLDSEWRVGDRVYRHTSKDSDPSQYAIVHFSAFGKPWYYPRARAQKLADDKLVTQEFVKVWTDWWREADLTCPGMFHDMFATPPLNSSLFLQYGMPFAVGGVICCASLCFVVWLLLRIKVYLCPKDNNRELRQL